MPLNLKNIQKYRNTILLISVLGVIVCVLLITASIYTELNRKSPLVVTGNQVEIPNKNNRPTTSRYDWTGIDINTKQSDLIQKWGQPSQTLDTENKKIIRYLDGDPNVGRFHEFHFQSNKLVYIKRDIDPTFITYPISQVENKYPEKEILDPGNNFVGVALYKFNIENNAILVAQVFNQTKEVLGLEIMTKEEFELYNQARQTPPAEEPEGHLDLDVEQIVD